MKTAKPPWNWYISLFMHNIILDLAHFMLQSDNVPFPVKSNKILRSHKVKDSDYKCLCAVLKWNFFLEAMKQIKSQTWIKDKVSFFPITHVKLWEIHQFSLGWNFLHSEFVIWADEVLIINKRLSPVFQQSLHVLVIIFSGRLVPRKHLVKRAYVFNLPWSSVLFNSENQLPTCCLVPWKIHCDTHLSVQSHVWFY